MTAEERITALIRPDYVERIPSFVRKHATERSCAMIARDYPEMYAAFSDESEPDEEMKREMARIANDVFVERINKHHVL